MNALRWLGCLLLFLFGGLVVSSAENVAKMPKPTAYVDDFAGVMTPEGKAQVEAICREVHEKTKAQIFFVTIKSLEDNTIESLANDLFHNWKIGEKKTDRGILLLLAVKEHKRRIEVGYGLEGVLNDAKAGDIGRDMVPALKMNDYDEAALTGVKEIAKVIAADASVTLDTIAITPQPDSVSDQVPPPPLAAESGSASGRWILGLFPFFFFFAIVAFVVISAIRRSRRLLGGGTYYDPGINSFGSGDSSSSFSSDSSSTSTSTSSSSDDSFSGGDGGDSGGGGASGDW